MPVALIKCSSDEHSSNYILCLIITTQLSFCSFEYWNSERAQHYSTFVAGVKSLSNSAYGVVMFFARYRKMKTFYISSSPVVVTSTFYFNLACNSPLLPKIITQNARFPIIKSKSQWTNSSRRATNANIRDILECGYAG